MAMSKPNPLQLPSLKHQPNILSYCRKGDYEQLFERLNTRKHPHQRYTRTQFLLYAAAQGNFTAVHKLVERFKCDPRFVYDGLSPLHCAIAYGHMEIVKYFVEKGCSPKSESNEQFVCTKSKAANLGKHWHRRGTRDIPSSLLFICKLTDYGGSVSKYSLDRKPIEISHIHVEILKFLFDHGWTCNEQRYGYKCLCKFLMLSARVDDLVDLIDHNHLPVDELKVVLEDVITDGVSNIEMLEYLINEDVLCVTIDMLQHVVRVAHKISDEVCLCLLEHCTEDIYSTTIGTRWMGYVQSGNAVLLDSACEYKLPVLSKAIAERNLNSQDSAGRTPLHIACKHDDLELVSFLVSQQCDQSIADANGYLALHVACMHSSLEILELLSFNKKDRTDKFGNTVVHLACEKKREDVINYLIKNKSCAMNVLNNSNALPLHIFVSGSKTPYNLELLAMLCDSVDVNTRDSEGCTPVKLACDRKAVDIVEFLACEKQCRLDVQDNKGELPLNCFVNPARYSKVKIEVAPTMKNILSCSDFDVDTEDKERNTLLHCACSICSLELVRYLVVEKECNVNKVNAGGDLPLHLACRSRSLEIVKLVTIDIDKCNLTFKNNRGHTPLHIVCDDYGQGERKAIAQHLVDIGCRPVDNPELFKDLDISLACVDENDFDSLLSKIATKDNMKSSKERYYSYYRSPLQLACDKGNLLAVRHFVEVLECDFGTPYQGKLPVHYAAAHSVEMVKCVIKDADVNVADNDGNTPLHIACQSDKTGIVNFFSRKSVCDQSKLNKKQEYPLHLSCKGSLETVKLLTITAEHLQQVSSSGLTPLHVACKFNKQDIVEYLLEVVKEQKLDVNSIVASGTVHPLQLACETGNAQMVKCLKENGVDISEKLPDGNTVLHIACSVGSLEMVKYLIDSGHDTLVANSRKEFPLHIACTKNLGLAKITSYKCGAAELEAKTVDGLTPLHLAASSGLLDVVKYLIETLHCSLFTPDSYSNNALAYACGFATDSYTYNRKTPPTASSIARYLVECGCNPMEQVWVKGWYLSEEERSKSLVQKVIDQRDLHLFKALFCSEMFVNSQDKNASTPLILLCKEACSVKTSTSYMHDRGLINFLSQEVEYLAKERSCDQLVRNSKQELALHLACESGHFEIVKCLDCHYDIKNGAGDTALHIVCRRKELKILERFVQESEVEGGVLAFNILNDVAQSPLHLAVINDSEEMVKLLLSEVKDISCVCKDAKGLAPVHYASSVSVLKVLTDHNIKNRDLLDSNGNTPLHTFINSKYYPLAEFLLSIDAIVDVKNSDGNTPMHLACDVEPLTLPTSNRKRKPIPMHFDLPTVEELLSRVSSLSVQNNDGDTPLHIACRSKDVRLVKLLLEAQHEVVFDYSE